VLFIAELVTLLDVRQLVSWHVIIGVLLVPPAGARRGRGVAFPAVASLPQPRGRHAAR
jgi:hypothetical protein